MKEKESNLFKSVVEQIEKYIKNSIETEQHYKLETLFSKINNVSIQEQNNIFNGLINYYLTHIDALYDKEIIEDEEYQGDITDRFSERVEYLKKEQINEKNLQYMIYIQLEEEDVTSELISHLHAKKISLPIDIEEIKKNHMSGRIKDKDIILVIKKIILHLAVIYILLYKKEKLRKNNSYWLSVYLQLLNSISFHNIQ